MCLYLQAITSGCGEIGRPAFGRQALPSAGKHAKVTALVKGVFKNAGVVKLVDTLDLGSSASRRGGSSPFTRTKLIKP